MGYPVSKLIAIAQAELGYKEKETNKDLDNTTANAGDGNYTKYARDLRAAGYYNGNKQGFAWCDVFHDWCHFKAAGDSREVAEAVTCQTGTLGAGCGYSMGYYKKQGRFFTSNPQPGDQIFFGDATTTSHTGIVETVNGTTITTIEGNTSNQVARRTYKTSNSKILGYGRPKYDAEQVEEVTPAAPADTELDKLAQAIADDINASGLDASAVLNRVQELLSAAQQPETPAPAVTLGEGDKVKMQAGAPVWGQSYGFYDWVYDSVLYVRDIDGDKVKVSTKKTGAITGSVHRQYLTKI